ncbi:MAG: dihydroorotate dehydrogenase [Spirochaetales bacterium]|nr:dihydroorotate dehydrogenase [Spirochaetales bacterium]
MQPVTRRAFPMGHKDGSVHLATVSGVASTKPELIRWFDEKVPAVDIVTTKSFQVRPNPGNREPVICETSEGNFGNSVGLRNPGMEVALPPIEALREKGLRVWLNVSVSADNPEDFTTLVRAFDAVADSIELNFSCPHAKAGFGASIGKDIDVASDYVKSICRAYPDRKSLLFIKLTPNVDNIGEIAKAVIDSGADGITAINTVGPELHTDPVSGKPILQNALGGRGGKSGEWVYGRAIEAIREIRQAVGNDIPIIGMGGVSDGRQCAEMVSAGADAVGIGSALAHVGQQNWTAYFDAVKAEAKAFLGGKETELKSRAMLSKGSTMQYRLFTVTETRLHSEDTLLLTLDGSMKDFQAGEFVFLWLPGTGEKPFSVAKADPLMFIIKKRGAFTQAVFDLKVGDTILLRGPYGARTETPKARKAVIVAGGTGEAVAMPLAQELARQKVPMSFLVGTSVEGNRGILAAELGEFGNYICVSDHGRPGRILDEIIPEVGRLTKDGTPLEDLAFYLIGPEIFMKIAGRKLENIGVSPDRILLSMERNTMCGVGLCGECSCGGRLACQWGTFMGLDFLEKENVL